MRIRLLLLSLLSVLPLWAQEKDNVPSTMEGEAIVRRNGLYYNNRPLYAVPATPGAPYYLVLTGDKPLVRFGGPPWIDGQFVLGFQKKDGRSKWLLDFRAIEFRYYGGRVEWVASDPEFPGVTVRLHALPLGVGLGAAAEAQVTGAADGDSLVWMLGAAYRENHVARIDALVTAEPRTLGFEPARAAGNRVELQEEIIRIEPPRGDNFRYTLAACSAPSQIRVADARQWKKMPMAVSAGECPVAYGVTPISGEAPITWVARVWQESDKTAAAPNPQADFRLAWERAMALQNRVVTKTPDPLFDFMARAVSHPMDGVWRGAAYAHGGSGPYPMPFLGWRTVSGAMAYGWNERVLASARHFLASQVTGESYKEHPELRARVEGNPELAVYENTLTHPGANPRYLGKGRLIPDGMSTMYNMQSIYFDQLVEHWRFTADPELEKILRPALELHLDYIARCFDPDGNGAYESFINSYLTDNQWYNGGDTAEETAFAYRGHLAARDMARRAGDNAALQRHEAKLALIRKGFFESVWVAKSGHPGAYREQGGHRRLHSDAWLPSIVHTMDSPGLLDLEQMASTLHFTEYGLQRDKQPLGGVRVWPSNWVPGVWSLRTKSPGEEHHLALAYCQAGMPEAAMEVIRGCLDATGLQSVVPGNFGEPWTGVDFTDFMAPFARSVVSGVFGYRPDRPNGMVVIAPQFPASWDHASIEHPEFKLRYQRDWGHIELPATPKLPVEMRLPAPCTIRLSVELKQQSAMTLRVPLHGIQLLSLTLNGEKVSVWTKKSSMPKKLSKDELQAEFIPGFDRSVCELQLPATGKAEIEIKTTGLVLGQTQEIKTEVGAPVELSFGNGRITKVLDAQGALDAPQHKDGKVAARIANNPGHHRVLAEVLVDEMPRYGIFDLEIRDPQAERFAAEKNLRHAPADATWTGIDLSKAYNSRVTEIFRQDYISPRPDTMSARLGRDAYLTWHGAYIRKPSPAVDLSNTWPRRPAPVYDTNLDGLQLGGDFTLEFWVWGDMGEFAGARIFEFGDLSLDQSPSTDSLGMRLGGNYIWFYPVLNANRATHIAVVCKGGNQVMLYCDGQSRDKRPQTVDLSSLKLGPKLRLGADSRGHRRLLGRVERVAIANGAIPKEQLQNRTADAAALPGTVADWRIPASAESQVASAVPGAPAMERQPIAFQLPEGLPEVAKVADGMLHTPQGAQFLWNQGEIAFTSLWDNWPRKVEVPVGGKGDSVWLLVAGSTNPMQVRIANAVLRFHYADGQSEELVLEPPLNFWSLAPFGHSKDYNYVTEAFSLPKQPPSQVQLGNNCRAMLYGWKLRPGVELKSVTLETLSQEVVIGLMGVSLCNP